MQGVMHIAPAKWLAGLQSLRDDSVITLATCTGELLLLPGNHNFALSRDSEPVSVWANEVRYRA